MKGSCLCGAVTVVAADHAAVSACHCGMCRRWGGGPLLAVHCGSSLSVQGETNVSVFKSSQWAERGFCARCGTHLYYRLVATNEYVVPAGLLQEAPPLELQEQIFVDQQPSYYAFANQTRRLTEAEVFAQYQSKDK